jgi:transcriptional regulator with XRE-family HTH domain
MSATKKRITQKQIALRAKISPDFLSHILHGRRPCPKAVAVRLEMATGISKVLWVWGAPEQIRAEVHKVCANDTKHIHHDR